MNHKGTEKMEVHHKLDTGRQPLPRWHATTTVRLSSGLGASFADRQELSVDNDKVSSNYLGDLRSADFRDSSWPGLGLECDGTRNHVQAEISYEIDSG